MQRTTARAKRRPLSELNVIDNFLFTTIMNDPEHRIEFSELILSAIFGKKISVLKVRAESVMPEPSLKIILKKLTTTGSCVCFSTRRENLTGSRKSMVRNCSICYNISIDLRMITWWTV